MVLQVEGLIWLRGWTLVSCLVEMWKIQKWKGRVRMNTMMRTVQRLAERFQLSLRLSSMATLHDSQLKQRALGSLLHVLQSESKPFDTVEFLIHTIGLSVAKLHLSGGLQQPDYIINNETMRKKYSQSIGLKIRLCLKELREKVERIIFPPLIWCMEKMLINKQQ